jgi:hypothetical protein
VALEGSAYCRSPTVQCPHCLRQTEPQGRGPYSPKLVGAPVVRAGSPPVGPLDGEEGRNATAARAPQDWELPAGKRLSTRVRQEHPQMALMRIGEDLYSHVPVVEQLQQVRQPVVVVAKPSAPPTWLAAVVAAAGTEPRQPGQWPEGSGARQRTYTYRLVRPMPLALERAGRVTSVEVWEPTAQGDRLYHNSGITDWAVAAANVAVVVQLGRPRWTIENEPVNVHKNHGSELTPNYGHGQQTLAMVFSLLTRLASVAQVVLALGDRLYQRCRAQESRRELWHAVRTLVTAVLVTSWPALLAVYLEDADASP